MTAVCVVEVLELYKIVEIIPNATSHVCNLIQPDAKNLKLTRLVRYL
jgi:hypothetical protein